MPERGEIQAGQRGGALPVEEREAPAQPEGPAPVQIQQNQPEPHLIPQDQPLALLPKPPAVLPYRPRRMDPNPFPPPTRGRRGGRGNNIFANNDKNRLGANWRNNPDLKEQEEHKEEVLPRPYRAESRIDHAQPEHGEMMEPEARRGERPTYRKPYPAYIDQIPLSLGFKVPNFTLFNGEDPHASSVEHIGRIQPEVTISDLAAVKQSEDEPAQDFITRFKYEELLFGDLAELADKASKYEELLREEQQKRNSSKGTYYKSPSSSIHLVQVESEEEAECSEEGEVAVAEMAKLKHPITCKALTKPPKDQKPPPFTRGFVSSKPTQKKVYSFDLTKVDALFDEMLLQKAIETPHRIPKPEELRGRQYCRWHNSWNHSTNSCVVFRDKRSKPTTEASSSRGRMVSRETIERPKATISARVVLCSKCKCEAELEVVLDRQSQPIPSAFDRIGTSSQDRARRKEYPRPAQHSRRMTEQPKKEISIKMPRNEKPLVAIIEGRWYAVGKSGRPTMELTRTQKRRVQRQYCMFLKNKSDAQAPLEITSGRNGKDQEILPRQNK
ncbi:unnamed protein product [Prunus armeniaca]